MVINSLKHLFVIFKLKNNLKRAELTLFSSFSFSYLEQSDFLLKTGELNSCIIYHMS